MLPLPPGKLRHGNGRAMESSPYEELLKDIDWAFAPLPAGPAKKATVVGGEYLAIFKQSKFPKEAWKFIK